VDGLYVNTINASTCQEKTTFVDNMVLHEYGNTLDVKTGKHEIFISDKNTGMQCIVVAKSDGTFELQTTTSVKIVSPAVTVQSPAITLDGPTHVTNVLNVDGATHIANLLTVDKDTITNEVSFNSHIHSNGNMGSPTGPRIK
jgi:phage baseplate assembly protein gpV